MDNPNSPQSSLPSRTPPETSRTPRSSSSLADALSGTLRTNSPNSNAPKAILSCDFCRQRKTKCDKAEGGCSNCKRAGIKCNMPTRQRLPRGRNGGRTKVDAELKARVGRLETLVRSLGGNERLDDSDALEKALAETTVQERPPKDDKPSSRGPSRKASQGGSELGRYLGGQFWSTLSEEVAGLREILDDDSDNEPEPEENSRSTPSGDSFSNSNNFSFVLCNPDGMAINPDAMQHPPKVMAAALCEIYLRAVDPVFKLIHRPSLVEFMQHGRSYLDYTLGDPAPEALAFAVYFAAVSSQTDDDCRANFGESKAVLTGKYKVALETALSRADLIVTTDITVLSAFLLLIIFSRVLTNDRRSWTLFGLALRIAEGQGLHREDAQPPTTPFWREIRRRVWNSFGVLDGQSAGDRGTKPLINIFDTQHNSTPAPLNINDTDMSFHSKEIYEQVGMTDCTFPLVCYAADTAALQLVFDTNPNRGSENLIAFDWETRKNFAVHWRKGMHEKFLRHCNPSQRMHGITEHVIEIVSIDLLFSAIRPMHKHPKAQPPKVGAEYILELGASALERALTMLNMPNFQDFLWFGRQYNQWHCIAVMLAELCVHTQGPAVDRSWAILDNSLDFYRTFVADGGSGMLWRPIEKLLKRAREKRAEALRLRNPANFIAGYEQSNAGFPSTTSTGRVSTTAPPQTANAAMAFTPYIGPPPDGTSLGLSPSEIRAANANSEAHGWQLPPNLEDIDMNFDNMTCLGSTESPDHAWQNWGSFTEGLSEDALFPMQTDDMQNAGFVPNNSPFPWILGIGQGPLR